MIDYSAFWYNIPVLWYSSGVSFSFHLLVSWRMHRRIVWNSTEIPEAVAGSLGQHRHLSQLLWIKPWHSVAWPRSLSCANKQLEHLVWLIIRWHHPRWWDECVVSVLIHDSLSSWLRLLSISQASWRREKKKRRQARGRIFWIRSTNGETDGNESQAHRQADLGSRDRSPPRLRSTPQL